MIFEEPAVQVILSLLIVIIMILLANWWDCIRERKRGETVGRNAM